MRPFTRWQFRGALAICFLALAILACILPAKGASSSPLPIPAETAKPRVFAAVSTPTQAPTEIRETVSALLSVNVRQEATKASRALGVLYSGASVTLTGECVKGWAEIQYKSGLAWVDSRYITGVRCEEEE